MAAVPGGIYYTFGLRDLVSPSLSSMMVKKEEAMRNMGMLRQSFQRVEESGFRVQRAIGMLSGALVSLSIISFVVNLTQRRLLHAQERVRTATEQLDEAIERYGMGSQQAERAARRLTLAQNDLARAQFEANVQLVLSGSQLVLLGARYLPGVVSAVSRFASSIWALLPALWAEITALAVKAKLMIMITGGLILAAAAAAYFAFEASKAEESVDRLAAAEQKLIDVQGQAPSWGLVKSFEDVTAAVKGFNVQIGGVKISIESRRDIDIAIDRFARNLRNEIWRAVG